MQHQHKRTNPGANNEDLSESPPVLSHPLPLDKKEKKALPTRRKTKCPFQKKEADPPPGKKGDETPP